MTACNAVFKHWMSTSGANAWWPLSSWTCTCSYSAPDTTAVEFFYCSWQLALRFSATEWGGSGANGGLCPAGRVPAATLHLLQQLITSLIILDSFYCGFKVRNVALVELFNSFIVLDSLQCCFQVRNEALMELLVAFVQLGLYLQLLFTCCSSCSILWSFLTACIVVFRYGMRH